LTALLASVRSAAEAQIALAAGAGFIDAKDPGSGALGALPAATVRAIVAAVGGRRPVSATVGDLPFTVAALAPAIEATAACGVDFVKVGWFTAGVPAPPADTARILGRTCAATRLVAVLLADRQPALDQVAMLAACGWHGVMLDTADKRAGRLLTHLDLPRLAAFVAAGRAAGLLVGLAGSLALDDVDALRALQPDYLGFRGALTGGLGRDAPLDAVAVARIARRVAAADLAG